MRKLKLYIGCGLTDAPEWFTKMVEQLKDLLRDEYEILDFIGTEKGTPADVYRHDIHKCVALCDIFVAVCDFGATGLGWEMGTAVEKHGKPVLALACVGIKVTRLVIGAETDHPNYTLERYENLWDIVELIRAKALRHFPQFFLQHELVFA